MLYVISSARNYTHGIDLTEARITLIPKGIHSEAEQLKRTSCSRLQSKLACHSCEIYCSVGGLDTQAHKAT